jgi:hypothetical protein
MAVHLAVLWGRRPKYVHSNTQIPTEQLPQPCQGIGGDPAAEGAHPAVWQSAMTGELR